MRRGWTIEDCSQNLRIRVAVLEAMEAGRFERLPNGAYALGFVRTYADFLGLDRDEIVRRVKAEAAALNTKTELVFPTPIAEGRLPSGIILLASVVLAAGAYGVWYYHTAADREPIPRVAAVPEQLAPAVPAPAAPSAPVSTSPTPEIAASVPVPAPAASTAPSSPPAAEPTSPTAVPAVPPPAVASVPATATQQPVPAAPLPGALGSAAAATTPEAAAPRQYGEASEGRIVIKATGDSWVQVREPAGSVVFSRILRAGESYNVPNQGGYLLATGSAGVLDIMVDGKKAPAIGRPGFVRKDVPLDPERLLAGTAVPPEAPRPASAAPAVPAAPAAPPAATPAEPANTPSGG